MVGLLRKSNCVCVTLSTSCDPVTCDHNAQTVDELQQEIKLLREENVLERVMRALVFNEEDEKHVEDNVREL